VQDAASSSPNANSRTEKAALRLIARAEQCTAGLTRKLETRGFDPVIVGEVIIRLCEQGLINDKRFAQLWLESRLRLTRTPRRLLISLRGRGIDRRDAEEAIKTVFDEEAELALLTRFAEKHSKKAGKLPLKFILRNEGFSPQIIKRYFDEE
jgi:regulatory protein